MAVPADIGAARIHLDERHWRKGGAEAHGACTVMMTKVTSVQANFTK
jgi:hypothetical protein